MELRLTVMIGTVICAMGTAGAAASLGELADECMDALEAGDTAAFQAAASAIVDRKDVFATDARKRAETCLSQGYGEPWEYSFPESAWLSVAEAQARLSAKRAAEARLASAAAATAATLAAEEAERLANAERVATLVYLSCKKLLAQDEVAAMTNQVCVDSFLVNGLPSP